MHSQRLSNDNTSRQIQTLLGEKPHVIYSARTIWRKLRELGFMFKYRHIVWLLVNTHDVEWKQCEPIDCGSGRDKCSLWSYGPSRSAELQA